MNIGGDQLIAIALLGVSLALGAGLFYLLFLLTRSIWTWVAGRGHQDKKASERATSQSPDADTAYTYPVTAADLHVIRTNLAAVSRQVEDLERKLRLKENEATNIISLRRK